MARRRIKARKEKMESRPVVVVRRAFASQIWILEDPAAHKRYEFHLEASMNSHYLANRARVRKRRIWVLENDEGDRVTESPRIAEIKSWWKKFQSTENLPSTPVKFRARAQSLVPVSRFTFRCPRCGELYATSTACFAHGDHCSTKGQAGPLAIEDHSDTPRDQREVSSRFFVRTRYHG